VVVACRTGDCKLLVRLPAKALPGSNPGQVVYTCVPLLTKQYNLVSVKER